jgi:hypothetical protein
MHNLTGPNAASAFSLQPKRRTGGDPHRGRNVPAERAK